MMRRHLNLGLFALILLFAESACIYAGPDDFNIDGTFEAAVDLRDLQILADEWLNDCDWLNWKCRGADLKSDEIVNFSDFAELGRM